jgi:hypothetical protein
MLVLCVSPQVLYTKTLMHDSDTTLKALPVINHQFRVPDARAPVVVSTAFTALVSAPLLLLIIGIFRFGGNFDRFSGAW